jgi:hypothetical protein
MIEFFSSCVSATHAHNAIVSVEISTVVFDMQQLHEGFAEVRIGKVVQERIDHAVEVADPEKDVFDYRTLGDQFRTHAFDAAQSVAQEEKHPAQTKHEYDRSKRY